ncbi:hypothetical protein NIES21_15380 [Anabaenopsis circularis NIES-21]|uniref:Uncharacterized protein n=1 Tax=Anabaenopsis circularis NIES-21 TaxID=1085406 RepID=A0A1Z4GE20_9CYAN|nr:hypothetical protein NIES21_15380 [Anabaenopsis circularis NIES-21]
MDNLTTCESEIKDAVTSSLEQMPQPEVGATENSIYNFTKILDEVEA